MNEQILELLNDPDNIGIRIEGENSTHYVERIMPSANDRGNFKWFAESKDHVQLTIDGGDLFPRVFFKATTLVEEMYAWAERRGEIFVDYTKQKHE